MADTGKLEKLKIIAYRDADLNDASWAGEYNALVNPETYQLDYKIEYNDGQGQGTSGAQPKYKHTKPEEFAFEFLFDSTGLIEGSPTGDIWGELKTFKQLLVDYDGAIHQPRHFKLVWGVSLFKCRLTSLQITFKLFKPDGTPIRALAKTQFKGSVEENLRVAREKSQSPDLTHERQVLAGDNLPLLCFRLYEDPRRYLQVAKANGLTSFRRLTPGQTLFFPPLAK
ncbi:CIS tube protein [Rufibacter hautae]|uniref:LysM peptidoglycan-binding domain-containing protein n=1 Tax=Rufibacter hautae TaxID=2595005 RepID=A0A5B6THG0_9BACT|nr:LysM peptidoglycan-binding domain-containing protein [Rufibacter hautae]KAA3438755.1 LysM peptidoglycan-binding domain-containing protein [Rufibacter hautae]